MYLVSGRVTGRTDSATDTVTDTQTDESASPRSNYGPIRASLFIGWGARGRGPPPTVVPFRFHSVLRRSVSFGGRRRLWRTAPPPSPEREREGKRGKRKREWYHGDGDTGTERYLVSVQSNATVSSSSRATIQSQLHLWSVESDIFDRCNR